MINRLITTKRFGRTVEAQSFHFRLGMVICVPNEIRNKVIEHVQFRSLIAVRDHILTTMDHLSTNNKQQLDDNYPTIPEK